METGFPSGAQAACRQRQASPGPSHGNGVTTGFPLGLGPCHTGHGSFPWGVVMVTDLTSGFPLGLATTEGLGPSVAIEPGLATPGGPWVGHGSLWGAPWPFGCGLGQAWYAIFGAALGKPFGKAGKGGCSAGLRRSAPAGPQGGQAGAAVAQAACRQRGHRRAWCRRNGRGQRGVRVCRAAHGCKCCCL